MAWKEYFAYNFVNTNLAAGSFAAPVFTDTITRFDTDADFEVMKRTHIATDSRILVSYRDDAYGRFLQNQALDLRCISGTILFTTGVVDVGIHPNNFLPYILTTPFLIRASTNFTASFADFLDRQIPFVKHFMVQSCVKEKRHGMNSGRRHRISTMQRHCRSLQIQQHQQTCRSTLTLTSL